MSINGTEAGITKQIKCSKAFSLSVLVPVQPRGLTASGTSANLNTLGRLSSTLIRFAVRNCKKCFRTSYLLVWGVGDLWDSKLILNKFILKGQIISKCFFLAEDSPKKRTKTRRILVKTNSFVRFLGESSAWQFAFEINWPLRPELSAKWILSIVPDLPLTRKTEKNVYSSILQMIVC